MPILWKARAGYAHHCIALLCCALDTHENEMNSIKELQFPWRMHHQPPAK